MPSISKRSAGIKASPIRKLASYAAAAEAAGTKVYYLNIGQPDILTPQDAMAKVAQTTIPILTYLPSKGKLSYREKLVDYYHKNGIELDIENIMVVTGASEGIFLAFLSCLDDGNEVIVPEPFYANYHGFAVMAGAELRPITTKIENHFALPSIDQFESLINESTRAILLCNPNNPTGCMYNKEDLEALGELVKKHDLFLIVDEVYREFCYGEIDFYSVLQIDGLEENAILVDSISKRYSACGARVGTIATRNQEVHASMLKYAQLRLSAPYLGQVLAEAALEMSDKYLDEVKQEYEKRRAILIDRLSRMPGVKSYLPQGAFYNFVELPIDDSDRFCQWLLEEFEHEGRTLMLSPGTGFYATEGLGKKEVRIAYVLNGEDLNKAMDCLSKALEVYPGSTLAKERAKSATQS